jgi:hypothetical protein
MTSGGGGSGTRATAGATATREGGASEGSERAAGGAGPRSGGTPGAA